MKKILITIVTSLLAVSVTAESLTAFEVMQKVDNRYTGDTAISTSTMVLVDKKGRERNRQLKIYSVDQGDVERSVSYFLTPADVKDTAYLSFDYEQESKDDDSWLYLPALKKVKRIAASDKSNSFMGSDFSFADINGVNIHWYDYEFISESVEVDGYDCWHISSTPKQEFYDKAIEETGALKSEIWVRKDNFVQIQGKIYLKKGKKVKYFSARDIQEIDGVWTPKKLQMITTKNGKREHSSVILLSDIAYNTPVEDTLFSTQAIQLGVPQ